MPEETTVSARAVAGNTIWGTAGRVLGGFFALGSLALISRALGPEAYGNYATVLAFFFIVSAVADGGLYQILVRDLGRPGAKQAQLLSTALLLRTTLVSAALLGGFVAFLYIPQYANIVNLAPLAALAYVPLSLGQLLMAVFQRHLKVRTAALIELIARAVQLLGVGMLWIGGIPQPGPFLGVLLVTTTLQAALLLWRARKLVPFKLRTTTEALQSMARDALPVGISLVFTLAYFRLDTVLLSLLQTSDAVGIYNLAYKLLEQLIFFPAMFIGVMTPILTAAYSEKSETFQRLIRQVARGLTIAVLPAVVGAWFLKDAIALLLGGEAFLAAAEPLGILMGAVVLIFAGTLLGALVVITGRQRQAVGVYATAMVTSIGLNLLLIPRFSYVGTAWVTVITEVVVTAGLLFVLRKERITFSVPGFVRVLGSVLLMAVPLALFAAKATSALGAIAALPFLIVCPILYGAALFLFRAITPSEVRLLLTRGVS